jgi:hypothetical protein
MVELVGGVRLLAYGRLSGGLCYAVLHRPRLVAIAAQPAPPLPFKTLDRGRVEGLVLNSATNAPIDRVLLRLRPVAPADSAAKSFPDTPPVVYSDLEGRFVFDRVAPGRYVLNANHPEYLPTSYRSNGDRFINIDPGANISGLRVPIPAPGSIAGKVVDENGEPMSGVNVFAERWLFIDGAWRNALRSRAKRGLRSRGIRYNSILAERPAGPVACNSWATA